MPGELLFDPTVLQLATDALPPAYDIVIGPVRLNYPWGDDLAGELFALAAAYIGKHVAKAWADIGKDRAIWGGDDP